MSRYIDADALIERLKFKRDTDNIDRKKYAGLECAISQCKKAPTADVAAVVRCKDCKYLEIINSREIYAKCKATGLEFKPFDIDTREHYCSYGERREENEG